jgi:hypothetical protein
MRKHIVDLKQYYTRGGTWFSYMFQLGILTANAKLFEGFFLDTFGWGVGTTVVIGIVGYIISATVIGGVDYKLGIWKDENTWTWNATPAAKEMSENVKEIKKAVVK